MEGDGILDGRLDLRCASLECPTVGFVRRV